MASTQPDRARSLLLLGGLIVVALTTLVMLVRGVDPIEIAATLFFAPVFVAFLYFGALGGGVTAVLAAVGYVLLRVPAANLVGWGPLAGGIASRSVGYLVFGMVGGWAVGTLDRSLRSLAARDEFHDATGLRNDRALRSALDAERARVDRYGGTFSVLVLPIAPPNHRGDLTGLGDQVRSAVRRSDLLAFVSFDGEPALAALLPETGGEGASAAAGNLSRLLAGTLSEDRAVTVVTHPEDATALEELERRMSPAPPAR